MLAEYWGMRTLWVLILIAVVVTLVYRTSNLNDRMVELENKKSFDGDWSQQSLRDDAPDSCPRRYREWATDGNGNQWLIGCWGSSE